MSYRKGSTHQACLCEKDTLSRPTRSPIRAPVHMSRLIDQRRFLTQADCHPRRGGVYRNNHLIILRQLFLREMDFYCNKMNKLKCHFFPNSFVALAHLADYPHTWSLGMATLSFQIGDSFPPTTQ